MTSALPPAPPGVLPPYDEPPPPPPGPPVRGQLRRSRTDKVIGGVAGGLARYSGIDPLLWRVGFVALAVAGGTGVLVYLLLWLLMPATAAVPGIERYGEPPVPVGPRSAVPGVTVAGLLITLGALSLLDRMTGWDPAPRVFLGAALLVVGLGLGAAAFAGGRSATGGLIALGVILSLALLIASARPWEGMRGGVGDRVWTPATAADVRPSYDGGVGDVRLDLSGVDVSDLDEPIRTTVHAGVGDVDVLVPRDADVRVDVFSGIGDVDVLGTEGSEDGLHPGDGTGSWVGDGTAELVLTVHAGVGDLEVLRG